MIKAGLRQLVKNRYNLRVLLKDSFSPNPLLRKNIQFKNIHKSERCFILGSGPSITTQDLKKLEGEIVITQNNFHVHEDIKIINPKYHCVIPFFHSDGFKGDWIEWFKSMEQRLPLDCQTFFHLDTKDLLEENNFFKDRINYLKVGLTPMTLERANVDITKSIMWVTTALVQCLTVAIYMGFKKIYLLGNDMDQVCNLNKRENLRFYGDSPITNNEYELKNDEKQLETGYIWYHFWTMWVEFILLRKEAERNNSEIINLTNGGILNCYKRESYKNIIK